MKRTKKLAVWLLAMLAIVACIALAACSGGQAPASSDQGESSAPAEAESSAPVEEEATEPAKLEPNFAPPTSIPEADEFGVITYDKWEDQYPLQVASYLGNVYNVPPEYAEKTAEEPDTTSAGISEGMDKTSTKADFLSNDYYPEIKVIGKGYGYAKYYTEPAGHTYSVWSIEHNGRLGDVRGGNTKGIMACYACKTPQIHFDAENNGGAETWTIGWKNADGKEMTGWRTNAAQGVDRYTENVSCSNCHVNDNPTEANIIRADWKRVLGSDWESNSLGISKSGMVCGQCHCDYSMALSETDDEYSNGEPTSPYEGGLDSITPENAIKFYDDHGIVDWTYVSTGAKMLSIRHAEFEIYYVMDGGSPMFYGQGYECADCHMPIKEDNGVAYTSHTWVSPLDDPDLVESCNTCHGDIVTYVKDIQKDIDGRNHELGERYADFILKFQEKVSTMQPNADGEEVPTLDEAFAAENGIDADTLAKLQDIQRKVCYYWNLPAADNSEGAHNTVLYNRMIDEGNKLLDEGDKLLGVTSSAADFEAWNAQQA